MNALATKHGYPLPRQERRRTGISFRQQKRRRSAWSRLAKRLVLKYGAVKATT